MVVGTRDGGVAVCRALWSQHPAAEGHGRIGLPVGAADADGKAAVLFGEGRFPDAQDLLECAMDGEPWCEAETSQGVRIVGEASALRRLFTLPLQGATGEALCLHRVGDCLVVLDAAEERSCEAMGLDVRAGVVGAVASHSPRASALRCHVQVEGDMVRMYPRTETAEPLGIAPPPSATTPAAACCEWHVREGLTLVAVVPWGLDPQGGSDDLLDFRGGAGAGASAQLLDLRGDRLELLRARHPSLLPVSCREPGEHVTALAVPLGDEVETETLIDAWLSCSLVGSPSLLCFFLDAGGLCRGCRFVSASEIPRLNHIAQTFRADLRCLSNVASPHVAQEGSKGSKPLQAFDPKSLRDLSHTLLESLIDRYDRDGGHGMILPGPLGPRLLRLGSGLGDGDGEDDEDEIVVKEQAGVLSLYVDLPNRIAGASAGVGGSKASPLTEVPPDKVRRAHITQALLMYHAAVRLAQPRPSAGAAPGAVKDVPTGSRWTAKSCRHPLRVRQMMLRAVRALHKAAAADSPGADLLSLHRRFQLLLASAFEFLADTFLAEDSCGDGSLEVSRYLAALRHLRSSSRHLCEYRSGCETCGESGEDFAQSVRRLEERILAKSTNAHLNLARVRQRQPWRPEDPSLRALGQALQELDAAEELVGQQARSAQRQPGAHECSLLASICKWKADLLLELATLAVSGASPGMEVEPRLRQYLEAQQQETNESVQPLPAQCERWLQSTISLSLRAVHYLASLPDEVTGELQTQARAVLARAYGDLGHIYASTGRYTKAMTHAKQGIELFNATKDKFHAARLQLWLCHLQLRLAIPQAALAAKPGVEIHSLLRGLSDSTPAKDSACTQVVAQLQRALKELESGTEEESALQREGQALVGRLLLRQALTRLASASLSCAVRQLCEEDSAISGALELLQAAESSGIDSVRESVELLLQASTCFKEAADTPLYAITHACLAGIYFCGRGDPRVQRLALTHCQHATASAGSESRNTALQLAVRLLEAKVLRRSGAKGAPSWAGEARAIVVLCDVSIRCLQPDARAEVSGGGCVYSMPSSEAGETTSARDSDGSGYDDEERVRTVVLAGDEQNVHLMLYLRQELSDVLMRLLRGKDLQEVQVRQLKALYCSLLTAWHAEAGRVEVLTALRDHASEIVASSGA